MSERLDDLLRDALRAEVSGVRAPEDGPRRLRQHLQRRRRRQGGAMLAAAAAIITAVATASLVVSRGDDDDARVVTDAPTDTAPDPTTATPPEAATTAVDPRQATGPRPEEMVATTVDGRLVVVDVASGSEVRELARAGAASDYRNAGSENFIDAVDVSPDGSTVYFSTCCEPAPGAMFSVPLDGSSAPVQLALDAAHPDVRPGVGDEIAVTNTNGVYAYELPVGTFENRTGSTGRELAEATGNGSYPFWLGPTSLAFQRFDPNQGSSIAVISDIDTESPTVTDLRTDSGVGWEHPVGTDAAIIIAEQCCAPEYADGATGRVVEPSTGEVLDTFDLDAPVADLDLSDNWLLVSYTNGEAVQIDLSADALVSEPLANGIANAAWVPPMTACAQDDRGEVAVAPCDAGADEPTSPSGVPLTSVDWDAVEYPIDCDGFGWNPLQTVLAEPAPGLQLAIVVVACDAGAGTPPRTIVVYDAAASTTEPHLLQTLWEDGELVVTDEVTVNGAHLQATGATYSSRNIPRCCPDGMFTTTWTWAGDRYTETSTDAPADEPWPRGDEQDE